MTHLTTLHYENENLTFKYDVSIDKQGRFTTTIPKEITEKLMSIGIKLNSGRRQTYGFFSAESLNELEKKVEETADKYSKKKLVDEKIVIKYAVDTHCSYCRSASRNIYPNGRVEEDAEGYEKGYHWIEGTKHSSSMDRKPYSLEVAFEIQKAKTWEFPNGEQTKEYVRLEESDTKDDEVLYWLTSLCGLSFSHDSTVKEIEYTKDIGVLFRNMILFIFNINEQIHFIFGEEFDLSKIEPLRLMGGNKLFEKGDKK
ncbi:MAG: hypothetical protein IMZ58_07740 [Thermoplasmata archaeon]|nr:hypothetical protein [Thermoplasmata archaeon]